MANKTFHKMMDVSLFCRFCMIWCPDNISLYSLYGLVQKKKKEKPEKGMKKNIRLRVPFYVV